MAGPIATVYAHGKNCSVVIDSVTYAASEMNFDDGCDPSQVTNFTSSGHNEVTPGIFKISGSFTLHKKIAVADTKLVSGSTFDSTITIATGQTYIFPMYIESISPKLSVKDNVQYTVKFQSNGAITTPVLV